MKRKIYNNEIRIFSWIFPTFDAVFRITSIDIVHKRAGTRTKRNRYLSYYRYTSSQLVYYPHPPDTLSSSRPLNASGVYFALDSHFSSFSNTFQLDCEPQHSPFCRSILLADDCTPITVVGATAIHPTGIHLLCSHLYFSSHHPQRRNTNPSDVALTAHHYYYHRIPRIPSLRIASYISAKGLVYIALYQLLTHHRVATKASL
ncbi:hypothetical protein N3K66_005426 [Trichothecium roseum]|uniref:Uncharacterized protein n=1 Tax=Trichothecium roseum TaxID=47278 RepID=A0ACC0UZM7_9HYPO|nr:hypothetical protein N3K66_005426 [Trichothecium roseum]